MREVTDMPAPYFAMPRAASQEQPHGRVGSRHGSERVQPGRQATTKARGEEESMQQHVQHLPQRHGSNSTAQNPPWQQQGKQQEVQEQHQAAWLLRGSTSSAGSGTSSCVCICAARAVRASLAV